MGYVDLLNPTTKEMWEVKRNTIKLDKAITQLSNYIAGTLHNENYSDITGWKSGGMLVPGYFVAYHGCENYYVSYWSDAGDNGVVYYDYYKITDWEKVGEIATGVVIIGGAAFLISVTGGSAAPVLVPLL